MSHYFKSREMYYVVDNRCQYVTKAQAINQKDETEVRFITFKLSISTNMTLKWLAHKTAFYDDEEFADILGLQ